MLCPRYILEYWIFSESACPTGWSAEPSGTHPNLCYKNLAVTKTTGETAAPKCPTALSGSILPVYKTYSELLSFRKWM